MSEPLINRSLAQPRRQIAKHILKKVFLEDWGLKLLALVITLALWLGVTGLSTPTTKRMTVPLVVNIASNAQITNTPQQQVDIEVTGDKRNVEQINRSDLTASLDLTDMNPGDWVISLSPDTVFVQLPQGVKLADVVPGRIAVNIEAVEEKELPVRPLTTGSLPEGFEVYSTSVLPARIRVRGPASVVSGLEYIETEPIDIAGKRTEFTARQVVVMSPDPKAALLNTVVDVVFRMGERRVERSFTIPVEGDPLKAASFVLYGPRTPLALIRRDDIRVRMVLNERGEEVPEVVLPADLQALAEVRRLRLGE